VDKLRIVLVGLGGFGSRWAEVVQRSSEATLAAVVDASAQARAAAADRLGDVPALGSVEEAIGAVQADAVLIVVPPALHEPVALAALEAGWHVLSEKPLADDLPAALRLVAAAERTGFTFMVSQNYRWFAHIATLRGHLRDGLIGELGSIRYTFNKAWDFGGWRATLPDVLLEDMTIHHADLLRYLTGRECEEVYAQSFRPSWSWFEGHSAASVLMRFGGELHVAYSGSWVGTGPQTTWSGTIEIEGTDGVLILRNDEITHYARGKPNGDQPAGRVLPLQELTHDAQTESLARFAAAVRDGTRPETDIRDNIRSFAIVCAALASARSGQPVRLKDMLP
jgi:predicted dehydrogenase